SASTKVASCIESSFHSRRYGGPSTRPVDFRRRAAGWAGRAGWAGWAGSRFSCPSRPSCLSCLLLRRVGLAPLPLQPLIHPSDDVAQALDAVPGFARSRELVGFSREADHH